MANGGIALDPSRDERRAQKFGKSGSRAHALASTRVRMSPHDRVEMILDGAVAFFASRGLNAQTRELARALGVSQSLIYHYFKTKENLVEQVYERAFMSRWRNEWITMLGDRTVPIADRLKDFYASYLEVIDDSDWVRMVMFYGLDNPNMPRRYVETHTNRILRTIAAELNAEFSVVRSEIAPNAAEIETAWLLHSTFFHFLVRKHVFKSETFHDIDQLIDTTVDHFLAGAGAMSAPAPRPEPMMAVGS